VGCSLLQNRGRHVVKLFGKIPRRHSSENCKRKANTITSGGTFAKYQTEDWVMPRKVFRRFVIVYCPIALLDSSARLLSLQHLTTRLATGWKVHGSNPGVGEIFPTSPDLPWGPPRLLYKWYRIFLSGVKWPGRGVDHPSLSSSEVKERVTLYLHSPSGPFWAVIE
jgi:hypothetical protein